jgi:hypothetical protein
VNFQARFSLEWGLFNLPNPVIPTETEHRESGALRSGGTLCCDVIVLDRECPLLAPLRDAGPIHDNRCQRSKIPPRPKNKEPRSGARIKPGA